MHIDARTGAIRKSTKRNVTFGDIVDSRSIFPELPSSRSTVRSPAHTSFLGAPGVVGAVMVMVEVVVVEGVVPVEVAVGEGVTDGPQPHHQAQQQQQQQLQQAQQHPPQVQLPHQVVVGVVGVVATAPVEEAIEWQ